MFSQKSGSCFGLMKIGQLMQQLQPIVCLSFFKFWSPLAPKPLVGFWPDFGTRMDNCPLPVAQSSAIGPHYIIHIRRNALEMQSRPTKPYNVTFFWSRLHRKFPRQNVRNGETVLKSYQLFFHLNFWMSTCKFPSHSMIFSLTLMHHMLTVVILCSVQQ